MSSGKPKLEISWKISRSAKQAAPKAATTWFRAMLQLNRVRFSMTVTFHAQTLKDIRLMPIPVEVETHASQ